MLAQIRCYNTRLIRFYTVCKLYSLIPLPRWTIPMLRVIPLLNFRRKKVKEEFRIRNKKTYFSRISSYFLYDYEHFLYEYEIFLSKIGVIQNRPNPPPPTHPPEIRLCVQRELCYSEPSLQRQHLFTKTLSFKWICCCKEYLMSRLMCKRGFVFVLISS